jgi:lysophospholipase L1-like esterase
MFCSGRQDINAMKSLHENVPFDTARIYQVMAKARRGEEITLGYIGGSITKGYAASSDSKRWINLVTDWRKKTFPKAKFNMINAGIGGTGSNIGAFGVKEDLLSHHPDFVIVEFAVNDSLSNFSTQTMEGLVKQILQDPKSPGLMMLCLREAKGKTAQKFHIPVAQHYKIPLVSFADLIDAQAAKDGVSINSIFSDGLHPLDSGMKYIAGFIADELDRIYKKLPDDRKLPSLKKQLPPH